MVLQNMITSCEDALACNNWDTVFELLKKITAQVQRYNNLPILLQAQYTRIKEDNIREVISQQDKQLAFNKISHSITELLNDIRKITLPTQSTSLKLVIFSANPSNTAHLQLETEVREISTVLQSTPIQVIVAPATRISDLQSVLLTHKPNFVHFSGHGSTDGIILLDEQHWAKIVPLNALAQLFELFKNNIKCVFLNACFSENQAIEIKKSIPYVVGMNAAIYDDIAIKFAKAFYTCLGKGEEIPFSFAFAKNGLDLNTLAHSHIPILLQNNN